MVGNRENVHYCNWFQASGALVVKAWRGLFAGMPSGQMGSSIEATCSSLNAGRTS
jgi:hypothetical protein